MSAWTSVPARASCSVNTTIIFASSRSDFRNTCLGVWFFLPHIQRQLQVRHAIIFRLRQASSPDVDLQRRENQDWYLKRCISCLPTCHEFFFAGTRIELDIGHPLLTNCALVTESQAIRLIIVTGKDARDIRQRVELLGRLIQDLSRSPWEITPGRPVIRHENSVSHEEGIADLVCQTGGRMPWRVNRLDEKRPGF